MRGVEGNNNTMKYGEHLKANIAPEYGAENYIQYEKMDKIILELSETKPARYVKGWGYSVAIVC